MKTTLLLLLLAAFALPPAPTPPGDCQPGQCLADGDSCEFCGTVEGFPAIPEDGWIDPAGSGAEMLEDDLFIDDSMGKTGLPTCTIDPQTNSRTCTSCGTISNNGGELSGPNGTVQNGGSEGDCIEVKFKMWFKYCQWTIPHSSTGGGGVSVGRDGPLEFKCTTVEKFTPFTEVCPCPIQT